VALVPWALVANAGAATIRVDPTSPTDGIGTLSDWSNAFHSLSAAIAASSGGDVIEVAGGHTYKPANQASSFDVSGISLLGGFAGYGAGNPDLQNVDPTTNGCVLSGDISNNDGANFTNYSDNCYHVVIADSLDNSNASGADFTEGGGMFLEASRPMIRHCRIMENRADGDGGGVFFKNAGSGDIAKFRDCIVINNSAGADGGGMYLEPDIAITRTLFSGNTADGSGGAIFDGSSGEANIYNCVITACAADSGGAIAAVAASSGTVRVVNAVIHGNSAIIGGGVSTGGQIALELTDSTVADNDGSDDGGGVWLTNSGGEAAIADSILWGNTSEGETQIQPNDATTSIDNSDVQGGWGGSGANNINANPLFLGAGPQPYALDPASPCINTGDDGLVADDHGDVDDNNTTAETLPLDFNLNERIVCTVDMGAFEYQPSCEGDINGDGTVDEKDEDIVTDPGRWGASTPGAYGNCYPWPCGDSTINVNDLLMVITHWGDCNSMAGGGGDNEDAAAAIMACIDAADAQHLSGEAWQAAVIECICAELGIGCGG
jgi:predicted outer membrane repeat protein